MANVTRRLAREVDPAPFLHSFGSYTPSADEVSALIEAAEKHPLGLSYLKNGYLDSVAATFEVHAFVVDDARQKLAERC